MNNTDFNPKTTNKHPLSDAKSAEELSLQQALENINSYLKREFEQSLSKDTDLHHVPMGYTTLGDNEEHNIQIEADLIDCSLRYIIDGKEAKTEEYGSLDELNELVLSVVDFDVLAGEGADLISQHNIAGGFLAAEDPYYISDEKGVGIEFLMSADDDTYEKFAERTPLIEESDYNSFDDLIGSDDFLNIYATVRENGSVDVTIGISGEEQYPVSLSDYEQEALLSFVSKACDMHMDKSLESMLAEAKKDESLLEPVYGKEFAENVRNAQSGVGNHGELYEGSARESRERDFDGEPDKEKPPKKHRDFER